MSDEEYSFLKVRRSSRKIHRMLKHSTPLTTFYTSSLPTVSEWEEDSYLANHNHKTDPQQVKGGMSNLTMNRADVGNGIYSRNISPLLTEHSAEDESFNKEESASEKSKSNVKQNKDANLEISASQSISRTPKKYVNRKKLKKLLIKEKVGEWIVQQLNNIEEATQHNLVIENV